MENRKRDQDKACALAGHRPNKLPFGLSEQSDACKRLKNKLANEILKKICIDDCRMFYTGMAWGTDIICAEIVLQIKCLTDFHPKLICVIPFQKQYETWPENYQLRYKAILEQADELVRISDDFHKKCLWERNKYIIGQCGHLIAVYDGKSKGGTAEKIEMAKRKDAKIVVIDPFALND